MGPYPLREFKLTVQSILGDREVSKYGSTRRFAAKRRGSAEYLDFADRRAKYVGMIIIALDQQYCVEGHLQIGR